MYVIIGATGNIGKGISELLLADGKKVKAIARNPEKLKNLAEKGAEIVQGDITDSEFLKENLKGATAVFAMIPPDYQTEHFIEHQNKIGESITEAIKNSGVKYVINLSSFGANLAEGTGPIRGLYHQEQRLNKLEGVNVLHLRPSYFFENFFGNIPLIKTAGINGSPVKGDIKFPMIATRDISEIAAQHFISLDFSGKQVIELLGERDLSMKEVTEVFGKAIGKPELPYVEFSYQDFENALLGVGFSKDVASLFVEMNQAINEGVGIKSIERKPENNTKTSVEEFAKVFAQVFSV